MVQDVKGARRLVYSEYWGIDERFPLKSVARSMSFHEEYIHRDQHSSGFELLRVSYKGRYSDKYSFTNVNMRFLFSPSFYIDNLPPSIFLLWNMETLLITIYHKCKLPVEMWKMRQLTHVEFYHVTLREPPLSDEEDESVVLHNLQTLTQVVDFKISEEVCKRIPNIRRLEVYDQDFSKNPDYCYRNIGRLIKLESLSLMFRSEVRVRNYLAQNLMFPTSLKEFSLGNTYLDWDDMRIIGSLPNLEVLKLSNDSFVGWEWMCVEGEFLTLKHLEICYCKWIKWNVESSHFPALDTLVLEYVLMLNKIPSSIGDIPTLRIVRLFQCSNTLMISAMKMLEEQETLGNDALQIQLKFNQKEQLMQLLEEVEKEGITCTNCNYTIPNQSKR